MAHDGTHTHEDPRRPVAGPDPIDRRGLLGRLWRSGLIALIVLTGSLAGPAAAQISAGVLDDFQDASTQGWVTALAGALPPVPPAAIADAGPAGAGDFALRITATGAPFGAGGKLVVNNVDPRWTGDYPAAGIEGLMLDVNNPNGFAVTLRLGIDGPTAVPAGGRWVSDGVVVPAGSGWVSVFLSLDPLDLLPGDGLASDVDATLANVGVMRLMHASNASWQGDAVAGQLDFDDVEAVPEPSGIAGLVTGVVLLASRVVRSRRS